MTLIDDLNRKEVLKKLHDEHSFNLLTDVRVKELSQIYDIDCIELCNKEGITYKITN